MIDPNRTAGQQDILVAALFGVSVGLWFAMLAAHFVPIGVNDMVAMTEFDVLHDWSGAYHVELRKKAFYVIFILLGGFFGFLAARWLSDKIREPLFVIAGLLLWIPLTNESAALVMSDTALNGRDCTFVFLLLTSLAVHFILAYGGTRPSRNRLHTVSPVIAYLVLWGASAYLVSSVRDWKPWPLHAYGGLVLAGVLLAVLVIWGLVYQRRKGLPAQWLGKNFLVWSIITMTLVPWSLDKIARDIALHGNPEVAAHPVSFIIGPATYIRFGSGLVPGIDFFSQYGNGHAYLFSYLIGPTGELTLLNFVMFCVVVMWGFCIFAYHFLDRVFDSAFWAAGITLVALILQFHFGQAHFFDPSSHFIRYPLLMVAVMVFVRWSASGLNLRWSIVVAAVVAFSIFWNTETGIYILLACLGGCLCSHQFNRVTIKGLLLLLMGVCVFFMAFSTLAFGWRALSTGYIKGLFEPLILYGSGFSAQHIEWYHGKAYIYNFVSPALALASLAWVFFSRKRSDRKVSRRQLSFLGIMSLLTIFFYAKYLNKSLSVQWVVDCFPALTVFAWWAHRGLPGLRNRYHAFVSKGTVCGMLRPDHFNTLVAGCCVVLLFGFLYPGREGWWQGYGGYGLRAYATYNSIINVVAGVVDMDRESVAFAQGSRVDGDDVALLTDRCEKGSRVAVVSYNDWYYLIRSKRSSFFSFVPSPFMFRSRQLKELKEGDYDFLFLPKDYHAAAFKPYLNAVLDDLLSDGFVLEEDGKMLSVYRRLRGAFAGKGGARNGFVYTRYVKSVTTSSYSPDGPPERIVDGSRSTFWSSMPEGRGVECWILLELKQPLTIRRLVITPRIGFAKLFPASFVVEISKDGREWRTVAREERYRAREDESYKASFDPMETLYLRLRGYPMPYKDDQNFVQIGELQFF